MNTDPWVDANLVRLQKAVLCANCEVISEGMNGHCAACGSEALLSLNGLLGGSAESPFQIDIASSTGDLVSERYLSAAA